MNIEGLKDLVHKAGELHRKFEREFPKLYESDDIESLHSLVRLLYSLAEEKFNLASSIHREVAIIGGTIEHYAKELQKNEHQMKFRLEEVLSLLPRVNDYESRTKLKTSIGRLVQFHRFYDYTVTQSIQGLSSEIEGLIFIGSTGEKEKKPPTSIMEKLRKVEEVDARLSTLIALTYHLYTHPSWVHKVEEALRRWHSRGLLWVEARNVEKESGVRDAAQILEGLALIGIAEKRYRGGEVVYRLRGFGKD
ncbi:hypothetical protein [Thermococcus sp.]